MGTFVKFKGGHWTNSPCHVYMPRQAHIIFLGGRGSITKKYFIIRIRDRLFYGWQVGNLVSHVCQWIFIPLVGCLKRNNTYFYLRMKYTIYLPAFKEKN